MSFKNPESPADVRSTDYSTIVCSTGKSSLGVDPSEQKSNIKVSKMPVEEQECVKKRKMDRDVTDQSKQFTTSVQKFPKSSQSTVDSFATKPTSVEESTFGKSHADPARMRASFHYFVVAWPMAFTLDRPTRGLEVYDIPEGMVNRFIVRGFYPYKSEFSGDSVGSAIQPNEGIPELEVGSLIAKLGHVLVRQLDQYMPSLSDNYPTNEHFWHHEFHSHGKFTGMEETEYFKLVVEIYKSHNFVEMLSDEGIRPTSAYSYSASKIFRALCKGLDRNKRPGIERKPIGRNAYLFQIRLKYDTIFRLIHNPVNYFGDLKAADEIFFC